MSGRAPAEKPLEREEKEKRRLRKAEKRTRGRRSLLEQAEKKRT